MNSKLSFAAVACAAVAGLAWARTSNPQDPVERLSALEKEVALLKAELAGLKSDPHHTQLGTDLQKMQTQVDQLSNWARAQQQAAAKLEAAVEDSRAKGFTYGINPDSRTALLQGVQELAQSMRNGLPDEAQPAPAKAPVQPLTRRPKETK